MNPKFYEIINEFLITCNKKEIIILDIGCAEIRPYSDFLIKNSTKYVGLDKSESLANKAKEKCREEKCEILLTNVEDLSMPSESFDIIVCNNMLAYTDQKLVLKKIYDLLKKDGLCISFNNNTIEYSLYKVIHPAKPWLKELSHSIIVLLNTWIFKSTGTRIFHTIYNTLPSLRFILNRNHYKSFSISKEKTDLPYKVIDFHYLK